MRRAGRTWKTFGRALHVEQLAGSKVAYCGLDVSRAADAPHPATWRDACRRCVAEIRRAEWKTAEAVA